MSAKADYFSTRVFCKNVQKVFFMVFPKVKKIGNYLITDSKVKDHALFACFGMDFFDQVGNFFQRSIHPCVHLKLISWGLIAAKIIWSVVAI